MWSNANRQDFPNQNWAWVSIEKKSSTPKTGYNGIDFPRIWASASENEIEGKCLLNPTTFNFQVKILGNAINFEVGLIRLALNNTSYNNSMFDSLWWTHLSRNLLWSPFDILSGANNSHKSIAVLWLWISLFFIAVSSWLQLTVISSL